MKQQEITNFHFSPKNQNRNIYEIKCLCCILLLNEVKLGVQTTQPKQKQDIVVLWLLVYFTYVSSLKI